MLTDRRFLFHGKDNKKEVFEQFRKSSPSEGRVLVASGMYEGIDLPLDEGRWQVLAKVPWLNLGIPSVAYMAEKDSEWYIWQTLRTVIQAAGRISRTENDFGVTIVLDTTFNRLINQAREAGLLPGWFERAIHAGDRLLNTPSDL
jgi:Rad3-related DNA helicase